MSQYGIEFNFKVLDLKDYAKYLNNPDPIIYSYFFINITKKEKS